MRLKSLCLCRVSHSWPPGTFYSGTQPPDNRHYRCKVLSTKLGYLLSYVNVHTHTSLVFFYSDFLTWFSLHCMERTYSWVSQNALWYKGNSWDLISNSWEDLFYLVVCFGLTPITTTHFYQRGTKEEPKPRGICADAEKMKTIRRKRCRAPD